MVAVRGHVAYTIQLDNGEPHYIQELAEERLGQAQRRLSYKCGLPRQECSYVKSAPAAGDKPTSNSRANSESSRSVEPGRSTRDRRPVVRYGVSD